MNSSARRVSATLVLALGLAACDNDFIDSERRFAEPLEGERVFPTVVHEPTAYGVLNTPLVVGEDREIPSGTACVTCHGVSADESWEAVPGEEFHTTISLEHGRLTCNQCHSADRTGLHLADGRPLEFTEVIRLCAQCHGSQYRDFTHAAHGGVNGHWDVKEGPRIRANCVDCHSPHSPAYKQVMPVFAPKDRALRAGGEGHAESGHGADEHAGGKHEETPHEEATHE